MDYIQSPKKKVIKGDLNQKQSKEKKPKRTIQKDSNEMNEK